MKECDNYLDFVIAQMQPYLQIDVRKKWLQNIENKKQLTKSNKWLIFAMFHISIPLYKFFIWLCLFKSLLLLMTKKFYRYAARQFVIYGMTPKPTVNNISINFHDVHLKWKDIETAYTVGDLNNNNQKNFFFEVITNGAIVIINKIIKRWNFLAHDHKSL